MLSFLDTSTQYSRIGAGKFHCPKCNCVRSYKHLRASQWYAFGALPIFPMSKKGIGEFVQCDHCHTFFQPYVLVEKTVEETKRTTQQELLGNLVQLLADGKPIEFVSRDLNKTGLERDEIHRLIATAVGYERHLCRDCGLTYTATVSICGECKQELV